MSSGPHVRDGRTGIIVKEILPNLLPYLAASLVIRCPPQFWPRLAWRCSGWGHGGAALGMTLYWVNYTAAVINGWWWWWLPPIIVVGILFISLFLIAVGLDEVANPRLRRRV